MRRISVSQISSASWGFERDVAFYASLGVDAIALLRNKVADVGVAEAQQILATHGLAVSGYGTCGFFSLDEPERWPGEIEAACRHIELAGVFGASTVTLVTGSGRGHPYRESEVAFRSILEQLLPAAEQAGVVIVLEHTGPLRVDLCYIHTLHDALDLAESVASPHFKICCELNNAWTERFLYEDLAERSQWIGLVQISDFAEGTLATPERVALGDGIIPLERIVAAIEASDYAGCYEIEQLGPEIERVGYEESLRQSLAFLTQALGRS
ncbi:sugar phosphate isomerase/epimerase [Myxococcota bacterium]|nr:sugar phosphate isomerase/epimerase [Myxococcota bacterium]